MLPAYSDNRTRIVKTAMGSPAEAAAKARNAYRPASPGYGMPKNRLPYDAVNKGNMPKPPADNVLDNLPTPSSALPAPAIPRGINDLPKPKPPAEPQPGQTPQQKPKLDPAQTYTPEPAPAGNPNMYKNYTAQPPFLGRTSLDTGNV